MFYLAVLVGQMFLSGRQDYSQKPTAWDEAVNHYCTDEATKSHKERGASPHPYESARWVREIIECQKRLGYMAKDRRDL